MKKSEMIYTRRVEQCNQTVAKSGDKKEKLKLRRKVCNIYAYLAFIPMLIIACLFFLKGPSVRQYIRDILALFFMLTGLIAIRMRNYYDKIINHLKEDKN